MAQKRADYFAAGTQVVWDVDVLREGLIRAYRATAPDAPTVYVAASWPRPGRPCPAGPCPSTTSSSNGSRALPYRQLSTTVSGVGPASSA